MIYITKTICRGKAFRPGNSFPSTRLALSQSESRRLSDDVDIPYDNIDWDYDDESGLLIIPAKGYLVIALEPAFPGTIDLFLAGVFTDGD